MGSSTSVACAMKALKGLGLPVVGEQSVTCYLNPSSCSAS